MHVRVMKFGGSSFRTLDDFRTVAALLRSELRRTKSRLVVVVSAMYGDTDRLLRAGLSLNASLSAQSRDALITAGELVSTPLLRIALQSVGVRATSLTGYQVGMLSDSRFSQAGIRSIDVRPLRRALQNHEVVVVAGAQAVDRKGRITMLGRNSSDLSAVALAAALGLSECEILSDVPGVFSGDPYLIPNAQLLATMSHEQLIDMSISGAKVIHHGAATYARDVGCRIVCRATRAPEVPGTIVDMAAPRHPAVVLHEHATYLVYSSRAQAERVRCRLQHLRTPGILIGHNGQSVLVCANADALPYREVTCGDGVPDRLPGVTLMTTFGEADVERFLVPVDAARALAAHIHSRMWDGCRPGGTLAITARPAADGVEVSLLAAGRM